jgi:DNA-binding MurR/RpiR family transcriptional regulator
MAEEIGLKNATRVGKTQQTSRDSRYPRDVIGIIVDMQSGFSKSNQRIAAGILGEPHRFVELPIEELTNWLDVSAPTITRFARTVGCEGLKDLKLKIMGSVRVGRRYMEPDTPPNSVGEIAERVSQRAQKTISDMHHALDLDRAERIIKMISRCHTLYAFGSGGVSSWLIGELQNRFFRLGIRVVPSDDHTMQLMLASTVERDDALLCCSLTGDNRELERVVTVAQGYGAKAIALCPSDSLIAKAVDLHLAVDNPPDEDILSPATMRYAYLMCIDVIAYGVAIERNEIGREKMRRIKQQLANVRGSDRTQPLCDW